ncbi:hypothetical protein HZA98_03955 [Candidatus Woesearchaeota archaeon]|nr:hypothetical protein [Candidatus Woesearchaeota archaeon]
MNERIFTSKIEKCHREWLAPIIGVPSETYFGIDFLDEQYGIEMKCRYNRWGPYFTIAADQVKDFPKRYEGREFFWTFLLYGLKEFPKEIKEEEELEPYVTKRDLWFLP